jgi:hypothetical protein
MTQNGGGSFTPPPGTGGVSNGGRTPSERGGARSQSSDVSEGERKKEGWESVAVRVCCFWASTGVFYRHGRARELGFPVVAGAGVWRRARAKPGAAALGACWRGKVLASGHCGHALASSRRSASCREAEGKERGSGLFPPFLPSLTARVGAEEAGARQRGSPRACYRARVYGDSVGHSSLDFPKFCPPGVRHNARMNFKFEFLKTSTVGCQDIS